MVPCLCRADACLGFSAFRRHPPPSHRSPLAATVRATAPHCQPFLPTNPLFAPHSSPPTTTSAHAARASPLAAAPPPPAHRRQAGQITLGVIWPASFGTGQERARSKAARRAAAEVGTETTASVRAASGGR